MQEKFTPKCITMRLFLLTSFILLLSFSGTSIFAQSFCTSVTQVYTENFGAGTTSSSSPDVIAGALTYKATGNLDVEGDYRVINNTLQNIGWHSSADHTGNPDGKMLVVNGKGNTFFSHVINSAQGFPAGYFAFTIYFMNVNTVNNCAAGVEPPLFSFEIEYQAEDNSWVAVGGSTVSATLSATPVWERLGAVFALPTTGGFVVKNIRFTLNDGLTTVCGNDYAIDDINLALCVSGGPLPVDFTNISAKQKGAGISIDWSTASETNSKYFDIEKSIDGGGKWQLVSTVKASGNSSVSKKYNAYDSKLVGGLNYYRIKQVDQDGKFKYSSVVYVKVNIDKPGASVVTNPFNSNIAIDFMSKTNQPVFLSLYDVTGKLVSSGKMSIPMGTSRKTFDNVINIQKGVYILNIVDQNGTSLYKGKLVKQ